MERGSNQRTVVLFPGALGDLLLAVPALRALRAREAAAEHVLAVTGPLVALARAAGVADAIASLDDAATAGLFGGSAIPCWFAARPRVHAWIGAGDAATRATLERLSSAIDFHRIVRDDGPEHAAVAYARQVGVRADLPTLRAAARIAVPASERIDAILASARRPLLAVHAGAGAPAKRWDRSAFTELAAWWSGRGDVVELVGPADRDVAALPGARRMVEWPLLDVAALLAGVDAFAGNDSGVSHLAGALGARGTAVFVTTRAVRWAPLGARIVAIEHRGARTLDAVRAALARP